MDDLVIRMIIALVIGGGALGIALLTRRFQQPTHAPVDLSSTDLPWGAVVFTSSDCANCAAARDALKENGVPFREVTWELEPALFESIGVESVPLIVVRDEKGEWRGQIAGRPPRRALRSLVAGVGGPTVTDP